MSHKCIPRCNHCEGDSFSHELSCPLYDPASKKAWAASEAFSGLGQAAPGYWVQGTSFVDLGAVIGDGTTIWHFTHVMSGARIGRDCMIGQGCFVASTAVIGDGCRIQNNVSIFDGVTLEDDVFVGPSVVFTNVKYPRAYKKADRFAPTVVKQGAAIGANATIVCGVTIGEYAVIGAGAVITKDVEPYTLMVGPAARVWGR